MPKYRRQYFPRSFEKVPPYCFLPGTFFTFLEFLRIINLGKAGEWRYISFVMEQKGDPEEP